ncbi:MAG: class I SAM-dependent methyltransferase [Planctomycetota bacterium]
MPKEPTSDVVATATNSGPEEVVSWLDTFRCPECCRGTLRQDDAAVVCEECDHRYATHDGILDLAPTSSVPLPRMYDDADFREWNGRLAQIQDYFYESGGLIHWVQNAGHRVIQRWCRNRPAERTLDLGCGHGAHRPYLDDATGVIGLDIDQASLRRLREHYPDFFAIRGDAYRLPFADAVFDRIINIYNLEHLVHLDFALEEASRVLKPGGEFLVSVPAEGGLAWTTGRRVTSARNFTDDKLDYIRANAIDHCNCVWQIEKSARRHFDVERSSYFPMLLPSYHLNLVVTWKLTRR